MSRTWQEIEQRWYERPFGLIHDPPFVHASYIEAFRQHRQLRGWQQPRQLGGGLQRSLMLARALTRRDNPPIQHREGEIRKMRHIHVHNMRRVGMSLRAIGERVHLTAARVGQMVKWEDRRRRWHLLRDNRVRRGGMIIQDDLIQL